MEIIIKCPNCCIKSKVEMTSEEYELYSSGVEVQKIFPRKNAFFREVLISGMCYDCQSKFFNKPKPGEDWGEIKCECECCGAPIYEKDVKVGTCPFCKTDIVL